MHMIHIKPLSSRNMGFKYLGITEVVVAKLQFRSNCLMPWNRGFKSSASAGLEAILLLGGTISALKKYHALPPLQCTDD